MCYWHIKDKPSLCSGSQCPSLSTGKGLGALTGSLWWGSSGHDNPQSIRAPSALFCTPSSQTHPAAEGRADWGFGQLCPRAGWALCSFPAVLCSESEWGWSQFILGPWPQGWGSPRPPLGSCSCLAWANLQGQQCPSNIWGSPRGTRLRGALESPRGKGLYPHRSSGREQRGGALPLGGPHNPTKPFPNQNSL